MKKRTIISIEEYQPELDFEEAEHSPQFTFPEYQRELLGPRIAAGLTDLAIVAFIYLIFLVTTYLQMPEHFTPDKGVLGIYGVCYFALAAIYFFLFMLSASRAPRGRGRGQAGGWSGRGMWSIPTAKSRRTDPYTGWKTCRFSTGLTSRSRVKIGRGRPAS